MCSSTRTIDSGNRGVARICRGSVYQALFKLGTLYSLYSIPLFCLALALLGAACTSQESINQSKPVNLVTKQTAFEHLPPEFLPLDVVLIVDQSGSMVTTDPAGLRIKAVQFFLEYMSSWTSVRQDHRLGVVNFGSDAPSDKSIPLARLTTHTTDLQQSIARIQQEIETRRGLLGDTMFITAFREAKRLFDEANAFQPGRQPAIILLTDGDPDDGVKPKKPLAYFFKGIETYIQENLPKETVPIYVIAIDQQNRFWPSNSPYWERLSKRTFKINSAEREELIPVYMQVIGDLLGLEWEEVRATEVELSPYLERVSFTLLKVDPAVKLRIVDSKGEEITKESPGVIYRPEDGEGEYEFYSIPDPRPGTWKVEPVGAQGGRFLGQMKIYQHSMFFRTLVHSPRILHPLGQPIRFQVEFRRRDEKPVLEIPAYPLRIYAKVATPYSDELLEVNFIQGDTVYQGNREIEANHPGVYRVDLWVQAVPFEGKYYRIFHEQKNVEVRPLPYLQVHDSETSWHRSGEIIAHLMQAGEPVHFTQSFHPSESATTVARIRIQRKEPTLEISTAMKPRKEQEVTIFLFPLPAISSFGEDVRQVFFDLIRLRWGNVFRLHPRRATNLVEMKIVGQLADGSKYESEVVEVLYVQREEWWSVVTLFMFPITMLGITGVFALRQWGWWFRVRRMACIVHAKLIEGDESTECRLYGRKRVKVGLVSGNHLRLEQADGLIGWIIGRKERNFQIQDETENKFSVLPILFFNPSGRPIGWFKRCWAWFFLPLWPLGLNEKRLEPGRTIELEVTRQMKETERKPETIYTLWIEEEGG